MQQQKVLRLYRQFLRLSKTWTSATNNIEDTMTERNYIKAEAQYLFRKNKHLTDANKISDCIQEAQARMELAVHYRTPYPRPVNVPPMAMAKRQGKELGVMQERIKKQAQPIYIKSKME